MTRNALNFLVDVLSVLLFLWLLTTGTILRFILPPGSGPRTLGGLRRHDWGSVHFWSAVGLVSILVVHVALHWQWVCTNILRYGSLGRSTGARGSKFARNAAGVVFLLVVAAWLIVFAFAGRHSVQGPVRPAEKAAAVRGSATLAEVADANGLSVDELKAGLGLPADVPGDERLSQPPQAVPNLIRTSEAGCGGPEVAEG